MRLGQRAARGVEQRGVGLDPLDAWDHRRSVDHVAVDRLRAEDERARLEQLRAGDTDVQDRARVIGREPSGGCQRGLDRADAGAERLGAVDEVELAFGRSNDQHAADGSD